MKCRSKEAQVFEKKVFAAIFEQFSPKVNPRFGDASVIRRHDGIIGPLEIVQVKRQPTSGTQMKENMVLSIRFSELGVPTPNTEIPSGRALELLSIQTCYSKDTGRVILKLAGVDPVGDFKRAFIVSKGVDRFADFVSDQYPFDLNLKPVEKAITNFVDSLQLTSSERIHYWFNSGTRFVPLEEVKCQLSAA